MLRKKYENIPEAITTTIKIYQSELKNKEDILYTLYFLHFYLM